MKKGGLDQSLLCTSRSLGNIFAYCFLNEFKELPTGKGVDDINSLSCYQLEDDKAFHSGVSSPDWEDLLNFLQDIDSHTIIISLTDLVMYRHYAIELLKGQLGIRSTASDSTKVDRPNTSMLSMIAHGETENADAYLEDSLRW